jgi:tetratricopeptide (TPR) repeat protein
MTDPTKHAKRREKGLLPRYFAYFAGSSTRASPVSSIQFRVVRALALPAVCAACVLGCRGVARLDALERAEPLMRQAEAKAEAGDVQGAVDAYTAVLDRAPRTARAHLDLALLLHDRVKDYVAAIYHYRRYLALRPATEKGNLIEDRVRMAKQSFAAMVLRENRGVAEIPEEQLRRLSDENVRLRRELQDLRAQGGDAGGRTRGRSSRRSVVGASEGGG